LRELCRCAVSRGDDDSAQVFARQAIAVHPDDWAFRRFLSTMRSSGPGRCPGPRRGK
jgi:hypothetical protein